MDTGGQLLNHPPGHSFELHDRIVELREPRICILSFQLHVAIIDVIIWSVADPGILDQGYVSELVELYSCNTCMLDHSIRMRVQEAGGGGDICLILCKISAETEKMFCQFR